MLNNASLWRRYGCWIVCGAVLLCSVVRAETGVSYEVSKVAEGTAWVSSYWGYNAPKLVYDGDHYYTVALWGAEQATATGALYRYPCIIISHILYHNNDIITLYYIS